MANIILKEYYSINVVKINNKKVIYDIIFNAYYNLTKELYSTRFNGKDAEQMVTKLGMCSETFGLMSINPNDMFMRQKVLEEVNVILNTCYEEVLKLLREHEALLREMSKVLIEKEVMNLKDFEEVFARVEVKSE